MILVTVRRENVQLDKFIFSLLKGYNLFKLMIVSTWIWCLQSTKLVRFSFFLLHINLDGLFNAKAILVRIKVPIRKKSGNLLYAPHIYNHHVTLLAWISPTLSHHPSLLSIVPSGYSRLYPVSAQSCCK